VSADAVQDGGVIPAAQAAAYLRQAHLGEARQIVAGFEPGAGVRPDPAVADQDSEAQVVLVGGRLDYRPPAWSAAWLWRIMSPTQAVVGGLDLNL
jgi:hypothetical protein